MGVQAIVELTTGVKLPTPMEWPFTQETNEEQHTRIRLSSSLFSNGALMTNEHLNDRFRARRSKSRLYCSVGVLNFGYMNGHRSDFVSVCIELSVTSVLRISCPGHSAANGPICSPAT